MAVRPINASRFAEILEQWKKDCLQDNDQQSADVISDVILQLDDMPTLTPPNEPLTCGLVDRHGMPLRAGDTVAADKFFVYAVRYGSHNVNPDNCAPAYQVGW